MIYLGWYDDSTKKKTETKIDEAMQRYEFKYGISPNICLVSEKELMTHPRITVRTARHLRPNYFYVGVDGTIKVMPIAQNGEPTEQVEN